MASDDWKKRIRAEQLAKMERGATLGEEMDRLYSYHFNELEKEIRAFEQRYADKNGLSLAEVKARVDDFDVKAFEERAKRYVAEKNFSARANSELALYNLKMKTNRLALLQYNLDLELIALAEDERNLTERFLNDEFVKAIETQSGLLGRSVLSASQIGTTAQAILNTPFHGANWSDNIWKRQTALREVVARMTERLLLQGKNPTTMVAQLRKEFNVTASEAKRLAVTEGARVATEAQKQAYIANGYDEYEFIAEPSACRECAKLDGKIFKVKDMEPGENAAPMHPWCHCSTGAHFSEDKKDARLIVESHKSISGVTVPQIIEKPKSSTEILDNAIESGKIKLDVVASPDIFIPQSLSGKSRDIFVKKLYEVKGLGTQSEYLKIVPGTKITGVHVIAGKGVKRQIDVVDYLIDEFPTTKRAEWKKMIGFAELSNGRMAEVHWFEAPNAGKVKFKVKRYVR
ncbi:TPA: minor capsid protein [Streptococcus suis]